jgi:hypothetical protein
MRRIIFGLGAVALVAIGAGCAPPPSVGKPATPRCYDDKVPGGDHAGPVFRGVTTTPAKPHAGQAVTISWQLTDASCVASTGLTLVHTEPNANDDDTYVPETPACPIDDDARLVEGNYAYGTWRLTCTLPATLRGGLYNVELDALDALGNDSSANSYLTVLGGTADVDGPEISQITYTPKTPAAGHPLTVTWRAVDPSGIASTLVSLAKDGSGPYLPGRPGCPIDDPATRIAGSATDGIYRVTCTLPSHGVTGAYEIDVDATDLAGNDADTAVGPELTISGDMQGFSPTISNLSSSRTWLVGGDTLTVRWTATAAAGIVETGLTATWPTFAGTPWCPLDQPASRVPGTAATYQVTCRFSVNVKQGSILQFGVYAVTAAGYDQITPLNLAVLG